MAERLEVLKRLQLIKNKISGLEERKEYRLKEIKEREDQLENKRTLSEKNRDEKTSIQKEIGSKELDLKTDEEQIKKLNVQLNQIKTNKEFAALRTEIGCKEADKSILEDGILSMMSRLDVIDQEYNVLKEELDREGGKIEEFSKSVCEDIKKTDEDIEKLQNEQEEYLNLLDKETLSNYKRLSNIKDGKAIVEVEDNVCGGCFMNITLQTLNLLMGGNDLVLCPNCKRILILSEECQTGSR